MKFLDVFAGIGGFRMGMEMAGHECVGYIENDKYARKSYEEVYDTDGEWSAWDVRDVEPGDLPEADCYTAGYPCQSFSIAGNRGGFRDTRGTLFFEIVRLAKERQPKYLLLENVRGLFSHDGGRTFATVLNSLHECGYEFIEWEMLNSKDFGVPQNRERVFIVGHFRGISGRQIFPIRKKTKGSIEEYQEEVTGNNRTSSKNKLMQIGNFKSHKSKIDNPEIGRVYDSKGLSPCLSTMQGGDREPTVAINKQDGEIKFREDRKANCIDKNYYKGLDNHSQRTGVIVASRGRENQDGEVRQNLEERGDGLTNSITSVQKDNYLKEVPKDGNSSEGNFQEDMRIRRLTPRECWRLQGFPDSAFEKAESVNSDSQLYRQAGNAVTVPVVYEIATKFKGGS